jgi:hypothetical protein
LGFLSQIGELRADLYSDLLQRCPHSRAALGTDMVTVS